MVATSAMIRVTVTGINGNQARLGTEAPEDVHIVREELLFDKELAG